MESRTGNNLKIKGLPSSFPVVYSGANWNNANANNGISYFNRNTASNSNNNIGGRNLLQGIIICELGSPCPLAKNNSYRV